MLKDVEAYLNSGENSSMVEGHEIDVNSLGNPLVLTPGMTFTADPAVIDPELTAICRCIQALSNLDDEQQLRVLWYLGDRFGKGNR